MHATLASRDVVRSLTRTKLLVTKLIPQVVTYLTALVQDCCLIPEVPFYLEGPGGLYEFVEKRLHENGHMVIVAAEGAGQELFQHEGMNSGTDKDASGNRLLLDIGPWLSQKLKVVLGLLLLVMALQMLSFCELLIRVCLFRHISRPRIKP